MKTHSLFFVGRAFGLFSVALLVACCVIYSMRPERFAAFLFVPIWVWIVVGLLSAIVSRAASFRLTSHMLIGWLCFTAVFAEEPQSLLRRPFRSDRAWLAFPAENRLTVVSLNCAGGRLRAAKEVLSQQPDIVLLQETPRRAEDLQELGHALYGGDAQIVQGNDTSIISRFRTDIIDAPVGLNLVHAKLTIADDRIVHAISIRLFPPVIDMELYTRRCWNAHAIDRAARRELIAKVMQYLKTIPAEEPIILGGDFNVSASDSCLGGLNARLSDTFISGGVGWGHTVINQLPLFRLDQIWATSKRFGAYQVKAIATEHSDHRLVLARLLLK